MANVFTMTFSWFRPKILKLPMIYDICYMFAMWFCRMMRNEWQYYIETPQWAIWDSLTCSMGTAHRLSLSLSICWTDCWIRSKWVVSCHYQWFIIYMYDYTVYDYPNSPLTWLSNRWINDAGLLCIYIICVYILQCIWVSFGERQNHDHAGGLLSFHYYY